MNENLPGETDKCPRCGDRKPGGAEQCSRCASDRYRSLFRFVLEDLANDQSKEEKFATPSGLENWEPPSVRQLQDLLPQFEIKELIGRGGMGVVYRARQPALNRAVAIKLLPEVLAKPESDLRFVERFEQEARALASLNHSGIVTVHEFGETEQGHRYFVMELVEGMDLGDYLNLHPGNAPVEQIISILAQILEALSYAHENGIVHRDLKPRNILIDREGRLKIADFGIAKQYQGDTATTDLTQSGIALGTPDYIAPEAQDLTSPCDHRADIYACGVVLYQMLTGKLPKGKFGHPSALRPELDKRFDRLVEKALESNPDLRFQTASEFRAQLEIIIEGLLQKGPGPEKSESTATSPHRSEEAKHEANASTDPKRRHSWKKGPVPIVTAIFLVSIFAAAGIRYLMPSDPPSDGTERKPIHSVARSFENVSFHAWEGRRSSILKTHNDLSPGTAGNLLHHLDHTIDRFEALSGQTQSPVYPLRGHPNIERNAIVWNRAGANLGPAKLHELITAFEQHNAFPDLKLPEFACFSLADSLMDAFVAGPARSELSRNVFSGMVLAGLIELAEEDVFPVHPDIEARKHLYERELLRYKEELKDSPAEWFGKGHRDINQKQLTGGAIIEIRDQFGGEEFLQRWYQMEIPKLTPGMSVQDVVDNFYLSTSRAAERDLHTYLSETLRLPVSTEARTAFVQSTSK
ncbi:serine/threonine-protein kinase [Verrucomicrobiales bacterium BCK34]|nr:serine/threonine-protein kinase [Verrucomicrobiales bacterium BCK34]